MQCYAMLCGVMYCSMRGELEQEEVAEGLFVADFEQMRMENFVRSDKVEEINSVSYVRFV